MALSETERATAEKIVGQWFWQAAEGHTYRYRHAVTTLTRFYESAPMEADALRLVMEFLRSQEGVTSISLNNKVHDYETAWDAKDVWYQTAPAQSWHGTESVKVRIYQTLIQRHEDEEADGPYTVEDGCAYRVTHTFYWQVAELPGLPASSSGVAYTLQGVTRDRESGLFSCVIEKRERIQQDVAEYFTQKTEFETRQEEQHLGVRANAVASTGKEASVKDGVMVRRKVSKNADCTSDVANETVTEVKAEGAVEKVSVGLDGTVKTAVNRNMPDKADTASLDVGESVENAKTEGGLWTQTITTFVRNAILRIANGCRRTIFEHSHTTATVQGEDPGFTDAAEAAGGVISEKSVRRTSTGAYQVEEHTTTETPVAEAVIETRRTVSGTTVTKLDRNQPAASPTENLKVGESVRIEKTPGGLYNNQKTTATPANATIQRGCEKSGDVTHTDVEVRNEAAAKPGCTTAAPNVVRRTVSRLNENGTYNNETQTTTYAPKAATATGGTTVVAETVETGINQTNVPSAEAGTNRRVDVSVSLNDHGSMTTQRRTAVYRPVTATAQSKFKTETSTTKVTVNDTNLTPQGGEFSESSVSPNDHGSATTHVTDYTPNPVDSGWIKWDSETQTASGIYRYHNGIRIFKNVSEIPTPPSGTNCSVSVHINRYGLYDGSIGYSDLYSWDTGSSSSTYGGIQSGVKYGYIFRNIEEEDENGNKVKKTQRCLVSIPTITFYGRGNEGTEAYWRANGYTAPGISLNGCYGTAAPTFGSWEDT